MDTAGGGDYTSLNTAEATEAGDITAATGTDEYVEFHCTGSAADTAAVDLDTWTTATANYIEVVNDDAHGGKYNTGAYRIELTNSPADQIIDINEDFVRLTGLQLKYTRTTATSGKRGVRFFSLGSGAIYVRRCIVAGSLGGVATTVAGLKIADSDPTYYFANNLVYDFDTTGSEGISSTGASSATVYDYNNTVVNCLVGFATGGTGHKVVNCGYVSQGLSSADGFSGTFHTNSDYNASDIASDAPGTHAQNEVSPTFVDEGNDDFHLASGDTAWRGNGLDLSGDANFAFTIDIDGDTRSAWDIGADEFVSGGGTAKTASDTGAWAERETPAAAFGQTETGGMTDLEQPRAQFAEPDTGGIAEDAGGPDAAIAPIDTASLAIIDALLASLGATEAGALGETQQLTKSGTTKTATETGGWASGAQVEVAIGPTETGGHGETTAGTASAAATDTASFAETASVTVAQTFFGVMLGTATLAARTGGVSTVTRRMAGQTTTMPHLGGQTGVTP